MLVLDNIVGNEASELQMFRVHNVGSLTAPTNTANKGLLRYNTADDTLNFWAGAAYKRVLTNGMSVADIVLSSGQFIVGNGSNVGAATAKSAIPLSGFGAPTGDVSMGGQKLTNLGTPTATTDAANKAYVDGIAQGLNVKNAVRLKGTTPSQASFYSGAGGRPSLRADANGNINTLGGIDGVTTIAIGDRILIFDAGEANVSLAHSGIYEVISLGSAGTQYELARVLDADTSSELESAFTFVEEGTAANSGWYQTADNVTMGTTALNWTQFSNAGSYTAGKGLALSGSVFHFFTSSNYTTGDLYYANSTTTLAALGIGTSNRFLQSSGTAPQWSSYSMPSGTLTTNRLLYASSTTAVGTLSSANNSVLTTNGSGAPSWGTDLPTAITIGTAYIYRAGGTDVPLLDGGTGSSLTPVNGGIVYSTASGMAITGSFTSGFFVLWGGTGAPTAFNLFGTANSWEAIQTFSLGFTAKGTNVFDTDAPGTNNTQNESAYLDIVTRSRTSGGSAQNVAFRFSAGTSDIASNRAILSIKGTHTGFGAYTLLSITSHPLSVDDRLLTFTGRYFGVVSGSFTGVFDWVPTANRTIVVPNASGTLLLDTTAPALGSAGVARIFKQQYTGDNTNAYIVVTHGLGTRYVSVQVRQSNSGDTGSQSIFYNDIQVVDANTVRIYFNTVQTTSTYYSVVVTG